MNRCSPALFRHAVPPKIEARFGCNGTWCARLPLSRSNTRCEIRDTSTAQINRIQTYERASRVPTEMLGWVVPSKRIFSFAFTLRHERESNKLLRDGRDSYFISVTCVYHVSRIFFATTHSMRNNVSPVVWFGSLFFLYTDVCNNICKSWTVFEAVIWIEWF